MSNTAERRNIQLTEFPLKLMNKLFEYSITLIGVRREGREAAHCGSGTLVRSGERCFILTAAHCAEAIISYQRIGIPLTNRETRFSIGILNPIFASRRESEEWGPDLAFLPIHPIDVDSLLNTANKKFYNLDRNRKTMLAEGPQIESGVWSLVGAPDLLSDRDYPGKVIPKSMAYSVGVEPPSTRNDFDYIQIRVALDGQNALPTFQGVSGGGLWRSEVGRGENGKSELVKVTLEGCAFYETSAQGEYRFIRCHGRRSIYEKGLYQLAQAQR